ncbi:phosphoribosylformylglycinamidine cyclo-ligase [Clostridium punense]|uniref:Phosphoribosylformylglycinamidine cyclo-ligase n=1 Tax=Clostridium punense TaxID=1054297 RepID=A0ABS4JYZ7_9CLOT|nr:MULTISPECIES: phosphoribosylformylglycinamidine cyclo-ligase [Clostridium]EQB87438.1 phosphoribosylaminoimidazole synthetase [Clostridium sp. BL8]MBP2020757.1 phosphoribosylformylglycinamidine cyclo-ligase [Clostridium punense]
MISYKDAGVNIEEGYKAVTLMKNYTVKTYTKGVLNGIGSFAGMFELGAGYKNPVLVSGTDGVGTKLQIAISLNKFDSIGIDCVAMCVNDILCHGAKPLFFLDYIACGKLDAIIASDIVKGVSEGCIQSGAALIGGETAEMPGMYNIGDYDVAGFALGIVEKDKIIDGSEIADGDVLIGVASSGVHSNGFSLVRKLVTNYDEKLGEKTLGEILLEPTRIYVSTISSVMKDFSIKGMAHITGGGFYENIPRMFKGDFTAIINKNSYELPEIFKYLMNKGVAEEQMYNTFNMGIGMVLAVDKSIAKEVLNALNALNEKAYEIGYVQAGGEGVCLK